MPCVSPWPFYCWLLAPWLDPRPQVRPRVLAFKHVDSTFQHDACSTCALCSRRHHYDCPCTRTCMFAYSLQLDRLPAALCTIARRDLTQRCATAHEHLHCRVLFAAGYGTFTEETYTVSPISFTIAFTCSHTFIDASRCCHCHVWSCLLTSIPVLYCGTYV